MSYDRLFVVYGKETPANGVLRFGNEIDVSNWYGVGSLEDQMALEYFTGPNAANATMLFTRAGTGQRPHLNGSKLTLSLDQLRAINGSIALTFDGYSYSASVNLAYANSYADVAAQITHAFAASLPTLTNLPTGTWIEPQSIRFDATINPGNLIVEDPGQPPLVIGGKLYGPGIDTLYPANQQIIRDMGGGAYACFGGITTMPGLHGTFEEAYAILHTTGAVAPGQRLAGEGVPVLTSILDYEGKDAQGADMFLLNNLTNAPGPFHTTPPPLMVDEAHRVGRTQTSDSLQVQPNGGYGFNYIPTNDLSFGSGSAADLLGLSQATGAIDSTLGGFKGTMAEWYNMIVQSGAQFTSFQDEGGRRNSSLLWAASHPQYHYVDVIGWHTTPAGT